MPSSFMQTPAWERFQQSLGRVTYWLDGTLFVRHDLPFKGSYWYAPRVEQILAAERLDSVFNQDKKNRFVLIEPQQGEAAKPYLPAPTRQPRQTLLTSLERPEEKIMAHFKSKTRYNLRVAERKGIKIFHLPHPQAAQYLPVFMQLTHATNLRNQIKSHPETYYKNLLDILGQAGLASLHIAYQGEQPLSALILIRHEQTATYLFGASSSEDRNTMASFLLHWEVMKYARTAGDTVYDWWGVRVEEEMVAGTHEEDANLSQIQPSPGKSFGVTRFKLGFGGKVHFYPPAYVRSYSSFWYSAYKLRSHPGSFSY